jgi:hypothetical protein
VHGTQFERLTKRLQHATAELGQLVQKQHAAVRQAEFARTAHAAVDDLADVHGQLVARCALARGGGRQRASPAAQWTAGRWSGLVTTRPFRAPRHTCSDVALVALAFVALAPDANAVAGQTGTISVTPPPAREFARRSLAATSLLAVVLYFRAIVASIWPFLTVWNRNIAEANTSGNG